MSAGGTRRGIFLTLDQDFGYGRQQKKRLAGGVRAKTEGTPPYGHIEGRAVTPWTPKCECAYVFVL
jgi:hypothetical protein